MDFRKHSMLCYKIATKRQYGVTQKRNIQRVRVKVHYPLSPLNPKDKKGSKYGKSRKIKVLRDFLFLFSDTRKTQKKPFEQSTVTKSLLKTDD